MHSYFIYRPASFHTLFYAEKFPQLRSLFDDALTERVVTFHKRKKVTDNSQVSFSRIFFKMTIKKNNSQQQQQQQTPESRKQTAENCGLAVEDFGALLVRFSSKKSIKGILFLGLFLLLKKLILYYVYFLKIRNYS